VKIIETKVRRRIGLGMLFVGVILIIIAVVYGTMINWSTSMAAIGWLYPLVVGIILMIIGLIAVVKP